MRKTKSTARRSYTIVASSSSSEDDISLGASQEAAPTPPAMSTDVVSSNAIFGMEHKKNKKNRER